MEAEQTYAEFISRVKDIYRFRGMRSHLGWDQQTMMPEAGAGARASMLAWLAGQAHNRVVDPEFGELLSNLWQRLDSLSDDQRCNVREMKRERDKAVLLPEEHVIKVAEMTSSSLEVWKKARASNDYSIFSSTLEELVELARQRISFLQKPGQTPYDVLLDDYEHGMGVTDYDPLFEGLRERLVPLLEKIMASKKDLGDIVIPDSAIFDVESQRQLGLRISEHFGFDFSAGRLDDAAHPFCSGLWTGDTRITTRYDVKDPFSCIGAVMHETGHGLYEQGLPSEHAFTPRGGAISLGVHESQSRLWENQVGRSKAFWDMAGDWFRDVFPEGPEFSDEELYRLVNKAEPSFIRVEADEITYNLHIMLRYEVEKALFNDNLPVSKIPEMWNDLFKQWFGIEVPDDSHGCLQDIHWSMLAFGYFPTYTLGNLYAAQLTEKVCEELDMGIDSIVESGRTPELLDWLRREVHAQGMLLSPSELIESATGKPPSPEPFLDYVERKYGYIHGF